MLELRKSVMHFRYWSNAEYDRRNAIRMLCSVVSCMIACLAVAASPLCAGEAAKSSVDFDATTQYEAALTLAAAIPVAQLGAFADGRGVDISVLDREARDGVLEAAKSACQEVYEKWHASLPASAKVTAYFTPEIKVVLVGPRLAPNGQMPLPIAKLIPSLGLVPKQAKTSPVEASGLSALPSPSAVMSDAPADASDRVSWLRVKVGGLFEPLANVRLSKAEVPFAASELKNEKTIMISSLSGKQLNWLQQLYTKHCLDVNARQAILQRVQNATGARPKNIILDASSGILADPADTPVDPLPLWSDIQGDSCVILSMSYTITLSALDSGNGGVAWEVK